MNLRKSMISVAAAAVLSVGVVGCGDTSDSSTSTGAKSVKISNAVGSITGLVQDTNGNPLSGVNVYVAGQTTTTDAGGQYRFAKVPVTSVVGSGATADNGTLSVTIAAPTGYIGATVTVTPQAQIDNAESDGATNAVETFIDGFIASAGVAVLPATSSTVSGILRNESTQEPLANQAINFEFISGGTNGVAQEQTQNGTETTYAVSTYTLTTDATGSFSFASLPTDSKFSIIVPGYTTDSINAVAQNWFTSYDENSITLGNVEVTEITALDIKSPYVVSVNNVLDQTAGRGVLDDDTRNTFVVNFSETLDDAKLEITGNSILLYTGQAGQEIATTFTAAIDAAKKSITITTTKTLNDGDYIDIFFLNSDVVDTSTNYLGLGTKVGYESTKTNYTKLELQIFNEANINALAVTGEAQQAKDILGLDDDALVQASSNSFNDVLDETAGFQQLNSSDADLGGTPDAQVRLNALVQALGADSLTVGQTRITFTPQGAASYMVAVTDDAGTDVAQDSVFALANALSTNIDTANSADFDGIVNSATLVPTDTNPVEVYLSNVKPGYVVTITPIDTLGYAGTAKTITLVDNVAPRTILQTSYYNAAGNADESTSDTVYLYGAGGELSGNGGSAVVGTPYLAITNSLLDDEDAEGTNVSTGVTADKELKTELYDKSVINVDTNKPFINGQSAYDATAFATFNTSSNLTRTVGVAFSEDVDLNGTTPIFSGTAGRLSVFNEKNDVVTTEYGVAVNSDLVDMKVVDVIALANIDGQAFETIDYTGITDNAGNPATSATNAQVVIKDEMAPMLVKAEYVDGYVEMTFNEAITLYDTADVAAKIPVTSVTVLGKTATFETDDDTKNIWKGNGTNVISVRYSDFSAAINAPALWTAADYDETAYTNNTGTPKIKHGIIDISNVTDTAENSWSSYTAKAGATNTVATPTFAGVFNIAPIAATPTGNDFSGTSAVTADQTVVFDFSHALQIDSLNPGDSSNNLFEAADKDPITGEWILDDSEIARLSLWFQSSVNGTGSDAAPLVAPSAGNNVATLSADGKKLTLIFRISTASTTSTKNLVNVQALVSGFDTTQNINALAATADGI